MNRVLILIFLIGINSCCLIHSSAQSPVVKPTKGICIGNSTVAKYLGGAGVASLLFTPEETAQGYSVLSLAVPGHTIYQQLALWKACTETAEADWIIVEIGLNDLRPADPLDSALNRYQKMIDTINLTKKPGAVVILATMTPARQRFDVFKEQAPIAYKKWIEINRAILGEGPHAITGVNFRFDGHTRALSDDKGNLKPEYEVMRNDHVHENTAGRLVVASYWRIALVKLGLLELGGR